MRVIIKFFQRPSHGVKQRHCTSAAYNGRNNTSVIDGAGGGLKRGRMTALAADSIIKEHPAAGKQCAQSDVHYAYR